MAHESFEDQQVADYLNQNYVSIKVDREERPDIDHVYMMYCQAITGEGGWPLTVVMTPDAHPFFTGTYFPKTARYGRPGLLDVLRGLREKWDQDRDKLVAVSADMTRRIQPIFQSAPGVFDEMKAVHQAADHLAKVFDPHFGGFGDAPKFPSFHQLLFLLRYHRFTGENDALHMVKRTLEGMMRGGISDHVGGGIARYSTDAYWGVPHFEKMLYDNALAALTFTEVYQQTGETTFKRYVDGILRYVEREMLSPEGAFYAAQDADSEGQEGRFYVWRPDDVIAALGELDGERYCRFYDITEEGNFEGYNVPNYTNADVDEFADASGIEFEALWTWLDEQNEKLYEWRKHRVPPGTDDKVLTAWNALMIAGFAKAGAAFHEEDYIGAAVRAMQAVEQLLVRQEDGRLLARYRDGESGVPAYADDHAYLVWAYLELYQATQDLFYLGRAMHWQKRLDALFWDEAEGGYFLAGTDAASLIVNPKSVYDGATPSANSVTAYNLVRLYAITGNDAYAERLEDVIDAFGASIEAAPIESLFMVMALLLRQAGNTEVVVVVRNNAADLPAITSAFHESFIPEAVLLTPLARPNESDVYPPVGEGAALYVCRNFKCDRPDTDWHEAFRQLVATPPRVN